MAPANDETEKRRLDMAHRLIEACARPDWQEIFKPYFDNEYRIEIENLASYTDPMHIVRSAGAIQALRRVTDTESQARRFVDAKLDKKLKEFK